MKVDVVDLLVCNATVILQNIVVRGSDSECELLSDRKDLRERLVWDIVELCAVVLWNDESVATSERIYI